MKKTIEQKRKIAQLEKLATNPNASYHIREFFIKRLKALNASKLRLERALNVKSNTTTPSTKQPIKQYFSEECIEFNCEPEADLILNWD